MECVHEDCKSLLSQMKRQERQLRWKRRWLMGLPMSRHEQKKFEELKSPENRILPELFLREDDVYCETIKTFVERGFEPFNTGREEQVVQDNTQLFDSPNDFKRLLFLLDDMTNKGLCLFAEILTGGLTKFEKTRPKLKKIIKDSLMELPNIKNRDQRKNITKHLSQLFKDPHNFRENCVPPLTIPSQSYHTATIKVLDGLEHLPFQTLSAMDRKLRGIKGYVPQLQPPKSGWGRDVLTNQVRKICMHMLSELGDGDKLQEPLAKALAVASLTSKLILNCPSTVEFHKFSPEIEALHNDIAKAISGLNKFRFPDLKSLQLLLDPSAKLSNRSFRIAMRKLLIEYLLECSDMESIPECLFQTLAIINKRSGRSSRKSFLKEEIVEEVECLLSVSAQTKQIVLDMIPDCGFDQEFVDAYMEDLEDSGDVDDYDYDVQQKGLLHYDCFYSSGSNDQVEGIEETNPTIFNSLASATKEECSSPIPTPNTKLNSNLESMHITEMDSADSDVSVSSSSCWETKITDSQPNMAANLSQLSNMGNLGLSGSQSLMRANIDGSSARFLPNGRSNGNSGERQEPTFDSVEPLEFFSSHLKGWEVNLRHDQQATSKNQYLAIQEACDETSMVAYSLIGYMMCEFANKEGLELDWGDISYLRSNKPIRTNSQVARTLNEKEVHDSIVTQVLEELLPSFPESGRRRVRELMA